MQSAALAAQDQRVSDTMESARRWSGYVCPDCRFVFRVPRDHDGKGIVCPSCRRMLKIPAPGDHPPALLAASKPTVSEPQTDAASSGRSKKRRRKKSGGSGDPSWERQAISSLSRRGEQKRMRAMLIAGGLLFSGIVWGVIFLTKGENAPVVASKPVDPPPLVVTDSGVTGAALEKEAESMARGFLEATTIEEMLKWVRNPEVAEARMRRFYLEGSITAPGLSQFNSGEGGYTEGNSHSFSIITGDQVTKALAFVKTPQGLKIDWESWVGWSDIPWPDFLATKPAASHVFRVILAPVDYYNFEFSDDAKWECYRLESPDREHALYGYAEKDSPLNRELRPNPGETTTPLILALKFPPDSASGSQVLIERLVGKGWVEQEGPP
ncbi:MAG: hypothetical protein ACRCXD_11910 [Luteolibacter sp.]